MNAYPEDLRKKKIVEAKERGMPTLEVARTFGVGLSSVKRYAKTAREEGSLCPKRSTGRSTNPRGFGRGDGEGVECGDCKGHPRVLRALRLPVFGPISMTTTIRWQSRDA
jgi:hypothetical protein